MTKPDTIVPKQKQQMSTERERERESVLQIFVTVTYQENGVHQVLRS